VYEKYEKSVKQVTVPCFTMFMDLLDGQFDNKVHL
jgi:hypothetical protein